MAVQKNFVIRNGIEVNNNLLIANSVTDRVGIGTSSPKYTLEVLGGVGVTHINVLGVSTFNNLKIDGRITAGSSLGVAGQYLVSTGSGVSWTSPQQLNIRTIDTQVASVGVSTFNTTYTIGLLDVFINGVKLSEDEFTAADATTVTLSDACFGGETIEFISYSPYTPGFGPGSGGESYWIQTISGIHTLSNVGIGTTNSRFALEVGAVGSAGTSLHVNGDARIVGILTVGSSSVTLDGLSNTINVGSGVTINGNTGSISAASFAGDGSGLFGVVATGSGIVVLDDGSNVGTASTIDFGPNLSISPINAGITTVNVVGYATEVYVYNTVVGALMGYATEAYVNNAVKWNTTTAGIHTLSNVGVGTTNPTSKLTVRGGDISVGVDTSTGVILTSPNGTQYRLIVDNSGTLSTVAV